MINKVKLIGRSHMKEKEPSLIRTALLRFFSSIPPSIKPSMRGGLGLSIAKTIIELHDGVLTMVSNKQGTSLNMLIPAFKTAP